MNNFIKKILPILTISFFIFFIWFRFIRERLPQTIPFQLGGLSTIIISITCLVYLFLFLMLFNKKKLSIGNWLNILISTIISYLIKIENNPVYLRLESCVGILVKYGKSLSFNKIYIGFDLIPRFFFLLSFLLDVFYLKRLYLIYYTLFLTTFPLIIIIIKNILEYFLKDNNLEIDKRTELYCLVPIKLNDSVSTQLNILPAQELINLLTACAILKLPPITYECSFRVDYIKEVRKQRNISNDLRLNINQFNLNIQKAVNYSIELNLLLVMYKQIQSKYQKKINYFFHFAYFLIWTYLLVISFHTLEPSTLTDLLSWLPPNISNPFI